MRKDSGLKRYMSLGGLQTCYENSIPAVASSFGGLQAPFVSGTTYPVPMTSYQQPRIPFSHQPVPSQHFQIQHHHQQQQMYHQSLQQQQPAFQFTPSSSEVSTPSSPTNAFSPVHGSCVVPGAGIQSNVKSQVPRVWNYSNQEVTTPTSAACYGCEGTANSNLSSSYSSSGIEFEPTSPSHCRKNMVNVGTGSSQTMFSSSSDYTAMQQQAHKVILIL